MKFTRVVLAAASLLLVACDEKPPQKAAPPAPAPKTAAPASAPSPVPPSAPAGSAISALGISFPLPAGWVQSPPSNAMRLPEAKAPDASGDAAKACGVVFSTAGGEVQANIDRWAGQVRDAEGKPATPKISKRTVAGFPATIAEMSGTYSAGMGDTAQHAGWMLRGIIVESPSGLLFIKMTGPAEQMAAAGKAFDQMLDEAKKP